uniref:Uncharacterized protein n=1 Tax=Rhizophora mucronata TaxID=61149 RepID=A0A2P2PLE6_RHIMU
MDQQSPSTPHASQLNFPEHFVYHHAILKMKGE